MKILSSLDEIDSHLQIGLTIGNFDGVHLGHRKLFSEVKKYCQERKLSFAIMTFIPHPLLILRPQKQFLINDYDERRDLLEEVNPDFLIEINFDRDFSTISARDFLNNYILSRTSIRHLFLGHDFSFGSNKEGDYDFAKKTCEKRGVEVLSLDSFSFDEVTISSSHIRTALSCGDISLVNNYLGRKFFIKGQVIKGVGRGKKIGFPTANLSLNMHRILPEMGVYITQTLSHSQIFNSLTNIGTNPTFQDENIIHLETHILDFDQDIYGEELKVFFCKKIRDEKKFASKDDLIQQLKSDVKEAQNYDFSCSHRP